jgi:hypothetical protein
MIRIMNERRKDEGITEEHLKIGYFRAQNREYHGQS